ncbi:LOW QUALITY PROTEIN: period circadian protein homolog 3 [Hypomesus transpacificus]|uniref:LOW QUALITY PROTEIN: period circadian protein homolog 3 n=1 Tax=Hypomesus transpacificus TaxID=137520 RepID=UPI001F07EC88|nr:LOW QUALITY PROTEIN: period circadian protein homolog 3 [Hypomesus transpacificus]
MPVEGDSAQEGEGPSLPPVTGEGREDVSSRQQSGDGREGRECSGREDSGGEPSSGETGHEDEDMTSASHDLSSANHSPRSTIGSTSTKSSKLRAASSSCSLHSSESGQGEHHTEGSGSEQPERGRGQAHREMMTTVAEMKKRLPSDKCRHSKASTVEALHYALDCVKQVQATSEYYKLLMSTEQDERADATVCSLDELERVTSEHTLKNTDSLVVGFSLASGRVLYASEQAPSILCCRRKFLQSAKFVELLFHQDVNVFYSHTAQPHLPPWSHAHTAAVLFECAQVKSFFCRIRGGKDREGEMRYNPFRMTPYLLKVQGAGGRGGGEGGGRGGEEEPCCLVLAERIISGYEAPRIPTDKRIFTTTHSPGCVFLEVDDRAVPLLGYLPQDLIGTSLLTCVHPEDRPLMLSMHRKVLKYAGQPPFEHSPVRLRCRHGDYVTVDTSWSSFINPWSRKVAFIIGRHKVRTSPLNEDVFAARSNDDQSVTFEEIQDLQAKIHKLFLQPVHKKGSSGYGSLGSQASHEHHISLASSSDSNANLWEDSHREPVSLRQICADVNRVKSWGQQAYLDSRNKLTSLGKPATARLPHVTSSEVRGHEESRKRTHAPSYQQIKCVDSIIRYLESYTAPALKRKSESRSLRTSSSSSSTSDEDKPAADTHTHTAQASSDVVVLDSQVSLGSTAAAAPAAPAAVVVGAPLTDITLSTKAMSVVSVTSQCSYSSTIVHVPQPESEVTALEDAPMGREPADPLPTPACPAPSPAPSLATEELRLVGLTKEVLSAHTQKEEQEYVDRLRHRILQSPYSSYLQQDNSSMAYSHHPGHHVMRPESACGGGLTRSRTGKPRHKRPKPQSSSDSYASPPGPPCRPPLAPNSSWPSSESSQPQLGVPYPPVPTPQAPYLSVMGARPGEPQQQAGGGGMLLQLHPGQHSYQHNVHMVQPIHNLHAQDVNMNLQAVQMTSIPSSTQSFQSVPIQDLHNMPSFPSLQPMAPPHALNPYMTPMMAVILPTYPSLPPGYPPLYPPPAPPLLPQAPFTLQGFAPASAPFSQPQFQAQPAPQPRALPGPLMCSPRPGSPLVEEEEAAAGPSGWAPMVSSSRSSSPLQLNLLQEELPKPSEGASSTGHAHGHADSLHEQHAKGDAAPGEAGNQDAQFTSSEMLDLLLQEDDRCSNASGSGESGRSLGSGSASNRTTSHTGSSNSSKHFASTDSSDTSPKAHKSQEPAAEHKQPLEARAENPLWSMIQHTPAAVMMTYQIPPRAQAEVLAEDREKLRHMQPLQPCFSQEQRQELAEVHPWIQKHSIPQEVDTQGCVSCTSGAGVPTSICPPAPDSSSPSQCPLSDSRPTLDT